MDYRVEVKVKNNRILGRIESLGYKSIAEFCRLNAIRDTDIGKLINFKTMPLRENGTYHKIVEDIAFALNCIPEDLFSEEQMCIVLETNKHHYLVAEAEAKFFLEQYTEPLELLEKTIDNLELKDVLQNAIGTLRERERYVIEERFFNDRTLSSIADEWGVCVETVRHIECRALRKLRHPKISNKLSIYQDVTTP